MLSKTFWQATAERAGKTFVQAAVPIIGATTWLSPDWGGVANGLALAAVAAGMSVLSSIGSSLRGDPQSPSLLKPAADRAS